MSIESLLNSIQGPARIQVHQDDAAGLALREITRAEIKPLNEGSAQPAAAASETAAADPGASQDAAQAVQAASAPEQRTGSIVNTADHLAGLVKTGSSALQGGGFHLPDTLAPDVNSRLQALDPFNGLLPPEFDGPSRGNDARMGVMMRHNQDVLNSVARNAEMVTSLFKGTG